MRRNRAVGAARGAQREALGHHEAAAVAAVAEAQLIAARGWRGTPRARTRSAPRAAADEKPRTPGTAVPRASHQEAMRRRRALRRPRRSLPRPGRWIPPRARHRAMTAHSRAARSPPAVAA